MILYLTIGLILLVVGIAIMILAVKQHKIVQAFPIVAIVGCLMIPFGIVTVLSALFDSGKIEKDHLGIVQSVESHTASDKSVTTLHLTDGHHLVCEPTQVACQKARPGDIVVYRVKLSSSGFAVESRQVTFVTPGPDSQSRYL